MNTSYINPEEFNKQLAEKKLKSEDIAEILNLEINLAKNIFAGYKSIGEFEILKLHELADFSYPNLISKERTLDKIKPIKTKRNENRSSYNNDSNLMVIKLNVYQKINCGKCDFLIYNPINFCPNCGELLSQIII